MDVVVVGLVVVGRLAVVLSSVRSLLSSPRRHYCLVVYFVFGMFSSFCSIWIQHFQDLLQASQAVSVELLLGS